VAAEPAADPIPDAVISMTGELSNAAIDLLAALLINNYGRDVAAEQVTDEEPTE